MFSEQDKLKLISNNVIIPLTSINVNIDPSAPESQISYIYECINCGSHSFTLHLDSDVECSNCEAIMISLKAVSTKE